MRYHYVPPEVSAGRFGTIYICNHPVYSRCTLYRIDSKGLAVIQQRYDPVTKHTYWTDVDSNIVDGIYIHPKFLHYFKAHAKEPNDGLYPTVTVRQIMWALRMRPLKRQIWETTFDKCPI